MCDPLQYGWLGGWDVRALGVEEMGVKADEVDERPLTCAIGFPGRCSEAIPEEERNGGREMRVDLIPASWGQILQFCCDREGAKVNNDENL